MSWPRRSRLRTIHQLRQRQVLVAKVMVAAWGLAVLWLGYSGVRWLRELTEAQLAPVSVQAASGSVTHAPAGHEGNQPRPTTPAHSPSGEGTLILQPTVYTWRGMPVYEVINRTASPCFNLHIYSWSEEKLPVLAIGSRVLPGQRLAPLTPPFRVEPGEAVWFASPAAGAARQWTAIWQTVSGQTRTATLTLPDTSGLASKAESGTLEPTVDGAGGEGAW
ncbi:MAG: hypothetical protein K6T31_05990 [Alicyclobacillus sp.]|nr:hypothetical protein [Alicyclobacillus sp.]